MGKSKVGREADFRLASRCIVRPRSQAEASKIIRLAATTPLFTALVCP
jgi:hypothetical protein